MPNELILALTLAAFRPLFTRWMGYGWDLTLLIVCVPLLAQDGLWARVGITWEWLPGYLMAAVLLFLVSVLLTAAQPWNYLQRVAFAWRAVPPKRQVVWGLLAGATAVYEEAIWRVLVQSLMLLVLPMIVAVAITSILFTILHRHRTGNSVLLVAELFSFSVIVGGLMIITNDPLSAVVVHMVRNHLIYMVSSPNGSH